MSSSAVTAAALAQRRRIRGCRLGAVWGATMAAAAAVRWGLAASAWLPGVGSGATTRSADAAAPALTTTSSGYVASQLSSPAGCWSAGAGRAGRWRSGRGLLPSRRGSAAPGGGGVTRGALQPAAAVASAGGPWFSGIFEALSTIFISEMGDKTFFLTMILAMRRGSALALICSQTALWSMTTFSVSIGVALRRLPTRLGDLPLVNVAAALLMVGFGIQSLRERRSQLPDECTGDEKDEAECEIDEQLNKARRTPFLEWFRFSVLIFLAEWGDRSMLTTVTLAATRSPAGVLLGGCMGHSLAAMLAVVSGGILEKYITDRVISLTSGVLFIGFGVTTLLGVY